MRTYAGHSTAKDSNALYRKNLEKGQTGLSVAFDLPTQTGYDPDHELSRGEVGKVGVSIAHKGDMHALLDGIPLGEMNTSMTINATAAWLLALYMTVGEENGVDRKVLQGTTQNDIIKEFLSRGTYAFPPGPSMRLIADMIAFTVDEVPKWNPINICSYHLQEAGATPAQEIAYSLSTAQAVLDQARERVDDETFPRVFGRMSFFVNAGIRFVEEHAKLRAMGRLWEELGRERYGVTDEKMLRFRYGVQVNSLGLTESQPENNVIRIVLEALAVTMGRNARARALQLPAWNEALGLPRPWDQQWSLRIQQILAYETDLLDYPDIFEGSKVMDGLVDELAEAARAEMAIVEEHGGAVEAVDYMKTQLVESHRERVRRIESGELKVIGQNVYTTSEDSPLQQGEDGGILTVDPQVEQSQIDAVSKWRSERDQAAVDEALTKLADAARDESKNIMPPTLEAAAAGATTGEWAQTLRDVFGEYRAPTGVQDAAATDDALARRSARGGRAGVRGARAAREDPGRQAGPRRPLERRGADRRPCARRGDGRRLPGHPPDAIGDRPHRGGRGRARGRPLDPLRVAPRADPERAERAEGGGSGRPGRRGRDHPARRRGGAARGRHRPRLHAEGLRDQPHHGRHRRRSSRSTTASPPRLDRRRASSAAGYASATAPPLRRRST